MTGEPTFWGPTPAPQKRVRRKTADTSSDGLRQTNTPRQQRIVLDTLRSLGPMTRNQLAEVCHLPLSSICGRVAELMKQGSVVIAVEDGKRVRRDGRFVLTATFLTQRAG